MAQFKAINQQMEVNGKVIASFMDGMGAMKQLGIQILSENGISDPKPDDWFLQQDALNAFKQIAENIGKHTLFMIGMKIPENALFPPGIDTIEKALSSIDIAYHLNHRLHNEVLYNQTTGEMKEGIGHYYYKKINTRKAEIICDNPFPCDFDKGIITAMARTYKPLDSGLINVAHASGSCRKKEGNKCVYIVSW